MKKLVLIISLVISLTGCGRIYSYFEQREIEKRVDSFLEKRYASEIGDRKYILGLHKKYGQEITASELEKEFPKHVINNLTEFSGHESFTDEELLLIKDFRNKSK